MRVAQDVKGKGAARRALSVKAVLRPRAKLGCARLAVAHTVIILGIGLKTIQHHFDRLLGESLDGLGLPRIDAGLAQR